MPHDRIESDPTAGRGLFVSGIVLGLSVGLAVGHLLLFARSAHKPIVTASAEEFPPFDPAGLASSASGDVDVPDDISFSIMEVDDPQDVGRATISDRGEKEPLHFFPEAVKPMGPPAPMYRSGRGKRPKADLAGLCGRRGIKISGFAAAVAQTGRDARCGTAGAGTVTCRRSD